MSRAQADAFTPAERGRLAARLGVSGLALDAARVLALASLRVTGQGAQPHWRPRHDGRAWNPP